MPAWRRAQREAVELLGETGAEALREIATSMGYPPNA